MNSKRVIRELEQLISWRGIPDKIRVDNGPGFIASALEEWCQDTGRNIELKFIQKGKPSQNGYIERFNRTNLQGGDGLSQDILIFHRANS